MHFLIVKDFDSLNALKEMVENSSFQPDKIGMPLECLQKYHAMIDGVILPRAPFNPNNLSFNGIPISQI